MRGICRLEKILPKERFQLDNIDPKIIDQTLIKNINLNLPYSNCQKIIMHRKPPLTHPCDPSGRSFTSERELAEFKKRQQLRESSIEIRQLEAKLRQAYINQELALQRKQKEVLEFEKKQEKLIEAQLLEQRRLESLKEEKETDQKLVIEQIKYKMALDDQMVERYVFF